MAVLLPFNYFLVTFFLFLGFWTIYQGSQALGVVNIDKPITSSVELVGFSGLVPALTPGAASPAFNLLVCIDNGHNCDQYRDGGSVKVSYAGVPLAYGSIPSFELGAKEALTVAVNATSESGRAG
uniref:Late embryogenesis abundant protein LEA-2 subgroup domain-containing protein n=1 Tax=Leersia perrieri TaxID=77586 RepID=A0A0D9V4V6_9ORYZ